MYRYFYLLCALSLGYSGASYAGETGFISGAAPQVAAHVDAYNQRYLDLDYVSVGCLQCHSGTGAAGNRHAAWSRSSSFSLQHENHPVGIEYARSVRQAPQNYASEYEVQSQLPLVQGKVSCISCHALKDANILPMGKIKTANIEAAQCFVSNELTMPQPQHNLCLTCHKM